MFTETEYARMYKIKLTKLIQKALILCFALAFLNLMNNRTLVEAIAKILKSGDTKFQERWILRKSSEKLIFFEIIG